MRNIALSHRPNPNRLQSSTRSQLRLHRQLSPQSQHPPRRQLITRASDGPSQQPTSPSTSHPTDPTQLIVWGGRLPSTRRAIIGTASAGTIALVSNFCGITSFLLGLDGGKLAGQLQLDVIVPVLGLKRCADLGNLYEFQYPAQWLADQTLAVRAAQRAEQERSLDPPSLNQVRERSRARRLAEPTAAFGPAGSSGEENISVIVAPIFTGFQLTSLGTPRDQALWFLGKIAPEGSSRQATLLAAQSRTSSAAGAAGQDDQLYYEMEYLIEGPGFKRHNLSVYTSRDDLLYTFNAQCPESLWSRDEVDLRRSAATFRLLPLPTSRQMMPGVLRTE